MTASLPRQAGFQLFDDDVVVNRNGRKCEPGRVEALLYSLLTDSVSSVPDHSANICRGQKHTQKPRRGRAAGGPLWLLFILWGLPSGKEVAVSFNQLLW